MPSTRPFVLILGFLITFLSSSAIPQNAAEKQSQSETDSPRLINACVITSNLQTLVDFYSNVLGVPAKRSGSQYAEFRTGVGVVAIFDAKAQEQYIPGSAVAAANKSLLLEFRVENVDREYVRIQPFVKTWVKQPSNTPWGTRSMYFRDPDGNLVDFFELLTVGRQRPAHMATSPRQNNW